MRDEICNILEWSIDKKRFWEEERVFSMRHVVIYFSWFACLTEGGDINVELLCCYSSSTTSLNDIRQNNFKTILNSTKKSSSSCSETASIIGPSH